MMKKSQRVTSWILQIIVAVIIGHTLPFKFGGAEESIALFTQLGIEPFGRWGIGIAELIAVSLILIPRTISLGALLSGGLMAGALVAHLTKLGFDGDMGILAASAIIAGLASAGVLWLRRDQLLKITGRICKPCGGATTAAV